MKGKKNVKLGETTFSEAASSDVRGGRELSRSLSLASIGGQKMLKKKEQRSWKRRGYGDNT